MRHVYSALLYLFTPLLLGYLALRAWREPDYQAQWAQRFGLRAPDAPRDAIWVHAASMGEVQAAAVFIRQLRATYPETPLVVTTMTPTGAAHVARLFGEGVHHAYLPFDYPHAVAGFLRALRPRMAVIMEMELWPNLFAAVNRRGIPLLLVNARLSAASARGYSRVRRLMADVLACPTTIAAQTREHARRLIHLGAPPERVTVTGNLKFDMTVPASAREQGEALRGALGSERPVWVAASTRDGEEELVLQAFDEVRRHQPDVLLLLVPRHPDRFQRVAALCRDRGYSVVLRSSEAPCGSDAQILLGDTMGELYVFYAAADVAFVGGSLVPLGGQNVLEPAALGLPVIVGPHTFNFEQIVQQLVARRGLYQVADPHLLADAVIELLERPEQRADMGRRALGLMEANRGATERVMALVDTLWEKA
ncbi:lipid IV(A) 3-deoxy-D-manno-octulosonic acid transferase [Aquisalimonas asiatica]|uniref:3-deoxy-D-manno-octulosonic acid transferase n=1 Tax=Aquisalimonas asiatica TaxID=406100 RepID=A0A1H8VID3_9GAMM|nr:lipid IV(A) 3-deoxy-D-manno-octulosonic acid transferase [Aquisalimonas asiatica]SEP14648.1 3-deoxy-D-manno-octulosonic-acid transferase [Aquisalimonas asiatica]